MSQTLRLSNLALEKRDNNWCITSLSGAFLKKVCMIFLVGKRTILLSYVILVYIFVTAKNHYSFVSFSFSCGNILKSKPIYNFKFKVTNVGHGQKCDIESEFV